MFMQPSVLMWLFLTSEIGNHVSILSRLFRMPGMVTKSGMAVNYVDVGGGHEKFIFYCPQ